MTDNDRSDEPPRPLRSWADRISKAATTIGKVTTDVSKSLGRTAASAGELLADRELRKKGAAFIVDEASKGLKGIQQGVGTAAGAIGRTIQSGAYGITQGPKQLQTILGRIQKRIQEQRLADLLERHRNEPVDIQMGHKLYEDAPQELRTRLWCVLLENPALGEPFRPLCVPFENGSRPESSQGGGSLGNRSSLQLESRFSRLSLSETDGCHRSQTETQIAEEGAEPTASCSEVTDHQSGLEEGSPDAGNAKDPQGESVSGKELEAYDGQGPGSSGQTGVESSLVDENLESLQAKSSVSDTASPSEALRSDSGVEDEWEMVKYPNAKKRTSVLRQTSRSSRSSGNPVLTPHHPEVQHLLAAMLEVEWPLATTYSEDSRYATLLQITIGQDEVDEVIQRDIHRTFPEHPHFNYEQGQQTLFNVLKAYSLHDLEVGYCQGMAFVAGVLLMYLPEELAFRVFCRLMGETGMNLRRLYIPGLFPLKQELWKFEWLLKMYVPAVQLHLEKHGIPAVLYASQWFLTAFACPFPLSFVARVIDIMLIENDDSCMMRAAFAVMAELEDEILEMDDFEDILTFLKVQPIYWNSETIRRVLDYSLQCPITEEEIREAKKAVRNQADSFGRTEQSPFAKHSGQGPPGKATGETSERDNQAEASQSNEQNQGQEASLEHQLEQQRREMVSEELKVLLSMDMLWDVSDEGDSAELQMETPGGTGP